jgi:hypothetical protein
MVEGPSRPLHAEGVEKLAERMDRCRLRLLLRALRGRDGPATFASALFCQSTG